MKKLAIIALLATVLFSASAPLTKADAYNNLVIESDSGMTIYTPKIECSKHKSHKKNCSESLIVRE